ncbi:hypothetical protein [Oceanobacter mangrovi]|uniref:hypothetical protein n=1 Tax=Oceanobacter mangrovi TaxID=2862510 RepID=UPI001C8DDD0C|nr:hypothetical protein [Oceanobacter mangrovi]
MKHERFHQVWVCERAYSVAEWLILLCQIQPGHGLAPYLGVMPYLDNHSAVRLWVQQKYKQRPPEFQTLGDVRKAFVRLLPEGKGDW